jgi:AcrR family transcriptional regulator
MNEGQEMKSSKATNGGARRAGSRVGRPSKDRVWEVETRILDAAGKVFLEKGYGGTSIDEIADLAPASKPTIYAHFADKQTLFAAVVARVIHRLTDFAGHAPKGRTVEDKLVSLGTWIVDRALDDLTVSRAPQLLRHRDSRS